MPAPKAFELEAVGLNLCPNLPVATQTQLLDSSTAWFDMQLPLEADWLADTALLQSQGYPVVVEDFVSDWATNYMG